MKDLYNIKSMIPSHEFQFYLVPLNPYLEIVKTILVRSLIFHIFTRVSSQPLKQRLKQKRRFIFKKITKHFLVDLAIRTLFVKCKYFILFLIIIPALFSAIQNKKKVTGHSFYEVFELVNNLT